LLYFAYGSNMWRHQMNERCPENRMIGTGRLKDWRWIITSRGYASVVAAEGDFVLGTVYELTDSDVRDLDRFEGVAQGCYRKEQLVVEVAGRESNCLVYVDYVSEEGEPKAEYIERINNGIQDAGLPGEYVAINLRPYVPA
jgi:gamma-glutamylcyclotransferase